MRAFLLALWLLAVPAALPQNGPGEDQAETLIREFTGLAEESVTEKIALLQRISSCGGLAAEAFISRTMDKDPRDEVRACAFGLWSSGKDAKLVVEFLDARKTSPRFGAYISAVPDLQEFPAFEYLSACYLDDSLERVKPMLFQALSAVNDDRAFPFLEEQWNKIEDSRRSYACLEFLLEMPAAWAADFLERLLASDIPEARLVGAERLLTKDAALLARVEVFLQRETHPGVRAELVKALGALGTPEAAAALIRTSEWHAAGRLHEIVAALSRMPRDALREGAAETWHEDIESRRFRTAALALAAEREPGLDRLLGAAEKQGSPATRIVAAVARGRQIDNRSKIRRLLSAGDPEARWEMLDAIQSHGIRDAAVVARLVDLLGGSKHLELEIKSAAVLGSLEAADALPLLERALSASQLLLRVAAAKALRGIRAAESVRILVNRLPAEKGRVAWEICRSLASLTGRNHGIDGRRWQEWWLSAAAGFAPRPEPEFGARPWLPEKAGEGRYSFYGIPIDSHNIAFVLDVSGSMGGPVHGPSGEAAIRRLSRELTRTLTSLTPEHYVNLVFFASQVRKWRHELVPMKDEAGGYKQEALMYVRYLRAEGGTDLYGGLMAALDDEEVDAVVLLSDGEPTAGKYTDPNDILRQVLVRNRVMQAAIHTIGLGSADRAFLRRLAAAAGGTFEER